MVYFGFRLKISNGFLDSGVRFTGLTGGPDRLDRQHSGPPVLPFCCIVA